MNKEIKHICNRCGRRFIKEQMNSTVFYGDICDPCMNEVEDDD